MSTYTPPPVADNEDVYDEQIYPLMAQVIAICKANGIPMFASFVYAPERFCTTYVPGPKDDEASAKLARCEGIVYRDRGAFAAFTITTTQQHPIPDPESGGGSRG